MEFFYRNRRNAFIGILLAYAISFSIAYMLYPIIDNPFGSQSLSSILIATFIIDIVATIIIWLFSVLFKNASVYDPYWSVAPIAILFFWLSKTQTIPLPHILLALVVVVWGVRLTYNWAINFKGMGHQDWRYTMLKEKNPKIWTITNLFGIHLMPTVVVYLAMIPIAYILFAPQTSQNYIFIILGVIISLSAVAIQFISDKQMRDFRTNDDNRGKNIDLGLWKYSRHPNYFGEVMMWWGVWIIQMGTSQSLLTIIGPLIMTALFIFISIPMMEKHILIKNPNYIAYQKEVSPLIIWFRKK